MNFIERSSHPQYLLSSTELRTISDRIAEINLARVWWILIVTTIFSVLVGVLSPVFQVKDDLKWVQLVDIAGSIIFFILLLPPFRNKLSRSVKHVLPMVYAIFFVLLNMWYYFSVFDAFGDSAAYVFGVMTPSTLLLLPCRIYIPFLGLNHLVFCTVLLGLDVSISDLSAGLLIATVAVSVAGVASVLQFQAKRAALEWEMVIAGQNRKLELYNRNLVAKSADMDEVMAVAAHDLRAPLLSMASLCELEAEDPDWQKQPYRGFLDSVSNGARSMAAQVSRLVSMHEHDNLLDAMRVSSCDLFVCLEAAIHRALPRATQKGVHLLFGQSEVHAMAMGSSQALERVLDNLISNAIKFSPKGGRVETALFQRGDTWVIEIRDEGAGVVMEDRPHLFDKFARGANRPTDGEASSGLGLYIVKKLVDAMGGEVVFEPREPTGAIFSVSLPTADL